jgi:DNA replication and repair protein RecF
VYLTRLALADFRSYAAAELRLEPGVSTMLGANGEGKTNLVEAVAYVATLASHRVAADAPLVRQGAQRAVVRAGIARDGRENLVEIEINPGRANRARLNRAPVSRPREVLGVLRTVLFAPEDLALVKGDPEQRRRFLDDLLVATAPRYAAVRSDYERVLRQRTALLKSLRGRAGERMYAGSAGRRGAARHVPAAERPGDWDGGDGDDGGGRGTGSAPRMLEIWDEQLASFGAELLAGRLGLTAALRPLVAGAYSAVSGGSAQATIDYRQAQPGGGPRRPLEAGHPPGAAGPGARSAGAEPAGGQLAGPVPAGEPGGPPPAAGRAELASMLLAALRQVRAEEIERGVCLVGPHRDDLELRIGDLPSRGYASQGESWSAALALRLASYDLLRASGDDPVLLLDDVFAELDTGRRDRLAALVSGAEQVLVTAAVPGDVPAILTGAVFEVSRGTVTRAR